MAFFAGRKKFLREIDVTVEFHAIKAMIVVWTWFDLRSVCIFLNMEKPHSESALETVDQPSIDVADCIISAAYLKWPSFQFLTKTAQAR